MTITLFLTYLTIGAGCSGLLTQALKAQIKGLPSNIIALISSLVVGLFGTASAYILMGIPFDLKNITCMVLMTVCIWVGSMVGYDKVIQTISQIRRQ
jgi:hypothetical protein